MHKVGTPPGSDYPDDQEPVDNIPIIDKDTASAVNELINVSFVNYMSELRKADVNNNRLNIDNLDSIISEYLSPFILIGYLPSGEPVELSNVNNKRDEEAIFERMRKTLIRRTNNT